MKRKEEVMKKYVIFTVLFLFVCTSWSFAAEKKFPMRDITNTVVWAAGGGTDVCNRIVSGEMAKIWKVNINVINKPGGVGGSIGMNDIYSRPPMGTPGRGSPNPVSRPESRAAGIRECMSGIILLLVDLRMSFP